ncbi:hypothetical protein B0T22DRAFT_436913 [Podospora appendiculata]|uniref:Uncharacterized protein n=1 Tax=Podospora appendiculata TaxID=314037 RepID=A0AAE1CGJ9_9PEZI|nr:hypothetical protein B0T22DRAFT_436913 [Podospora appendiculata]
MPARIHRRIAPPNRVFEAGALIDEYLPLELRSPRGGGGGGGRGGGGGGGGGSSSKGGSSGGSGSSSSSSSSSGTGSGSTSKGSGKTGTSTGSTVIIVNNGGGGGGSGGGSHLPAWAIVLIVLGTLDFVLFFAALTYYIRKERKRKADGDGDKPRRFRIGYVLWNAFAVASFLWIPIKLFKLISGRTGRHAKTAKVGMYAKIDEGRDGTGETINSSTVAPPTPSLYGDGGAGAGYVPAGKYEPFGYVGATGPLDPSPLNSPDPGTDYAKIPTVSNAPPSYATAVGGDSAQEYFAQHPAYAPPPPQPSYSPQPSPGSAAVSFLAAGARQSLPPTHNPYSMSATYTPGT